MSQGSVVPSAPIDIGALTAQRQTLVNDQLKQKVLQYLQLGLGAGLAARGAQGVYNLGRRQLSRLPGLGPKIIQVPTPEEAPPPPTKKRRKLAGTTVRTPIAPANPATGLTGFFSGANAQDWTGHPLGVPAAVAATAGGAFGGWKLMDYILDRERRKELEGELAKARQHFDQTLLSAYDKQASALGQDLDELYALIKLAEPEITAAVSAPAATPATAAVPATWGQRLGQLSGGPLLAAAALALTSGTVAYNLGSKRRDRALLQRALAKRRRQAQESQPTRIYALPSPMSPTSPNAAANEDDLLGDPLHKMAIGPVPGGGNVRTYGRNGSLGSNPSQGGLRQSALPRPGINPVSHLQSRGQSTAAAPRPQRPAPQRGDVRGNLVYSAQGWTPRDSTLGRFVTNRLQPLPRPQPSATGTQPQPAAVTKQPQQATSKSLRSPMQYTGGLQNQPSQPLPAAAASAGSSPLINQSAGSLPRQPSLLQPSAQGQYSQSAPRAPIPPWELAGNIND